MNRLIAITWRLLLTLLVCAAILSFLRQWSLNRTPLADGQALGSGEPSNVTAPLILCVVLFAVGIAVRLTHWFSARRGELMRRRRLEAAHTFVGAPERLGARRSAQGRNRRD